MAATLMVGVLLLGLSATRRMDAHTGHSGSVPTGDMEPTNAVTTLITNLFPAFQDSLPIPTVAIPSRTTNDYCVPVYPDICFTQSLKVYDMPMLRILDHPFHTNMPPVEVWGYDGKYPGPTIEAKVGEPILVNWINALTNNGGMYPYWLAPDPLLFHGGNKSGVSTQAIRTVVHLHGAAVLPRYDGYPTNWFLAGQSDQYFYGNLDFNNDGQTLWYHDHAIGVTANNVYAGLAGFYLVRAADYDAEHGIQLPQGPHEIPLVFQDRDFAVTTWTENGVTYSKTNLYSSGLPWHYHAVVNGKITPYLKVEPRPYRFRILNGTGFRSLALSMAVTEPDGSKKKGTNAPSAPLFTVVGNEDGYLQYATNVSRIATMPGERVDVVVDFSSFTNEGFRHITVQNAFGGGRGGSNADVVGAPFITNLMQFQVSLPLSTNGTLQVKIPSPLVTNWVTTESMVALAMTNRQVTLDLSNESPFPGAPFQPGNLGHPFALINMTPFHEPITDFPHAGDIEVWEIINLSNEAHPLHIHLLDFRVVNRQRFASDTTSLTTPWGGDPNVPPVMVGKYIIDRIAGTLKPLPAYLSVNPADLLEAQPFETGPKDVVRAAPFSVTRIVMQWPTNAMFYTTPSGTSGEPSTHGRYIFHCHILDHEDSDMMRPLQVKAPWQPTLRTLHRSPPSTNRFNEFSLGYPYRLNQQYVLETSTDLTSPQWTAVTNVRPVLDIPNSLWVVRPPATLEPTRYYRILPVPPAP